MAERTDAGSRRATGLVILAVVVASTMTSSSACSPPVDLQQALQVIELSGGYYDAGIVDGKNKLLPSVSFRIVRTGNRPRTVTLDVHFRKIVGNEMQEFNEVLLQAIEFPEGNRTVVINARSPAGYTGDSPQSRAEMLKHGQFQDMRAVILARQSSTTWVELARFDLPRQVLTH